MKKMWDKDTTVDDVIGTLKDMMANFATMPSQLHEISSRVEKEVSEKTDPREIVVHYLMTFTFLKRLMEVLQTDIQLALDLYPDDVKYSASVHLTQHDEVYKELEHNIELFKVFKKDTSPLN